MMSYWVLFIGIAVVSWLVQMNLQNKFKKYSKIPTGNGMTGRDVALKMLHDNGIYDVQVTHTPGRLTDHYNPANKTVNLSEGVYESNSIMAAAVAAHECGHAVQHARMYAPLKMRSALVPVVSFASSIMTWVLLGGILLLNTFPQLLLAGIILFAMTTLFRLVVNYKGQEYHAQVHHARRQDPRTRNRRTKRSTPSAYRDSQQADQDPFYPGGDYNFNPRTPCGVRQ